MRRMSIPILIAISFPPMPLGRQIMRILGNRHAWPPILVFMALYSIWTVFGATWGIPYWNQVQHLSLTAAGWRLTVFVAAFALGCWSLGRLSDRWRRRQIIQWIGGLLAFAALLIMSATPHLSPLGAWACFLAVGLATGVTPVCYASMRENNPPESAALGIAILLTGSDLAAAATQYLSGHVLNSLGAHRFHGVAVYSASDYRVLWGLLAGWAFVWFLGALLTRETRTTNAWAPTSRDATRVMTSSTRPKMPS